MGGKNPVKQIATLAAESIIPGGGMALRGVEATANAFGAQGIADAARSTLDQAGAAADSVVDQASGDAKKKADAESATKATAVNAANLATETESKKRAAADAAQIESDRMAVGSKSRTLLTGPAGLEDESGKKSVSRRTLSAR